MITEKVVCIFIYCCDPALSVLFTMVSRNAFHVVSALQSFAFMHVYCMKLLLNFGTIYICFSQLHITSKTTH